VVGIDAADEVLHALVQIGSPSGGDCRPAAWVVAWALLPGAIAVAQRAPAGPETDALVASQLWLEIRQFPWWRHRKVAGNVLANMRSAIAREGALRRPSWAERRTVPTGRLPEQQLHKQVSPSEELIDVLSWGRAGRFDRIWRSPPARFIGGADGSVGRPDGLSQRTGTDVSLSVGRDGGGIRTVARDGAQTGAAEHRRAGFSLPVRPIRAFDLSTRGCCANPVTKGSYPTLPRAICATTLSASPMTSRSWPSARMSRVSEANPQDAKRP
jgi:hypothetical protein